MTTWVLLRGLGREAAHWHDLPERLAARTGAAVLTPDLPGVGAEGGRPSPWTMESIVRDLGRRVAASTAADGRPQPVSVLGHSLGGMVAMRWAAMAAAGDAEVPPIERLVVIGSSLRRMSPPWRRLRPGIIPSVLRTGLARDPRRRESLVLDMTSTISGEGRARILDERTRVARERPMSAGVVLRQLAAATRERGPERLAVPVLVVVGERDRLVHPSCSRRIAAAFGGGIKAHPDAGHDVPLDATEWLVEAMADASS